MNVELLNKMNIEEREKAMEDAGYRYSHTALVSGYVSRRNPDGYVEMYKGLYGEGLKELLPNWDSSRFCLCKYFIKKIPDTPAILRKKEEENIMDFLFEEDEL